jgi:YVTN family beta-propeller protein
MHTKIVRLNSCEAWAGFVFSVALAMVLVGLWWVTPVAARPETESPAPNDLPDNIASLDQYAYVTLSSSNLVAVVDTGTNALVSTIDVGAAGCSFPWRATIKPDGSQVYVSCRYSNNVVVINSSSLAIVHVIGPIPQADDIAFRRDGQFAFIGSRFTNQVVVVNTSNYFQLAIPTNGYTRSLAAHSFLDLIYVTSGAGEILILDSVTNTITGSIDVVNEPWDVVVSPDGQWLYTGDRWGQGLSVVDLNSNSVITTLNLLGALTGLDIAPDGSKLYAARLYDGVYIIDTATWQAVSVGVSGQAWETAVTCDGSKLYVGSTQGFVPIIDTTTQVVVNLPMPGYGARGIAICPQYVADGLILFPQTQQKQGALGSTILYTTTLRNETGESDSFDLALAGNAWPTEISTSTLGPLNQGEAATLVVTVTVPSGAAWYDTDTVTVTATSVTSPTVYSETAVLTTEAYAPPVFGVAPDSLSSTQLVNSQVTQTVTISNGHGVTLTYDLAIFYSTATPMQQQLLPLAEPPTSWLPKNEMLDLPAGQAAPAAATVSTPLFTILTDPLGDGGPADVIEVLAGTTPTDVTMKLIFAPGVTPQSVLGYVFIDTDQNPDTGADPVDWFGLPTQDVGFEYRVSLFSAPSTFEIIRSDNIYMGSVTPVYESNSVLFTIPLAMLGNDDGNMNVAMVLGDIFDPTEWVPDVGHGVIGATGLYDWLTVSPDSGAIFSNSSDTITVTYDSSGLQPGVYPATIQVQNNDPVNPVLNIPVEMTVGPTDTMGWVEGYVTDGRFGTPLPATIVAVGEPYTITAGLDGYYKLWLEAGSYDLHVSASGYVAEQLPITIVAQAGLSLDVPLVEDVPVFGLAPDNITITQEVGDIANETMTIFNNGPAALSFAIGERDTTSGLALLAHLARSEAEMAALLAGKAAGEEQNRGTPTVAPIPAEAFASLTGSTNLLAWTGYVDYGWEYANALNAIAQYTTFNLTETNTEDPAVLAGLLATADVFLIPDQEYSYASYLFNLGQSWASVLQAYVNGGGTIVVLDGCVQTFQILKGASLVDMQFNFCSSYHTLEVVNEQHPLVEDVSPTFFGQSGIAFYTINDGETVVKQSFYDKTIVMAKDVGAGHVAVIGFDYNAYNDEMARILANAVQWYSVDVPWLTTTPVTGTVPGYDILGVQVTLDATGLQPGLYTADLIVTTNDPYTPTLVLPVSMEVLPTTTMGQVTGTVTDGWTGSPLTATVQLEDVHTTTAKPTYTIWAEAGSYTLTAWAAGYMTETVTVTIIPGGVTTQNLALVPAQPRVEGVPESLMATAVVSHTTSLTFTLANTGPLPFNFAWHEMAPVNQLANIPSNLTGKSILFDLYHGGASTYNFTSMIQDITAAGGVVVENYSPITAELLAPHDVLWVNCCGYWDWSAAELAAISAWLQQGGAIFLHGGQASNTGQLAGLFGITYECCYYFWGNTTNILPHPTTEGIGTIYVDYADWPLAFGPAGNVLFYDPSGTNAYAVAQEENGGRIVVVSANTFYDWFINSADNRAFALNVMNWLASPVYTDVPWVQTEPVSGTIPAYSDQLFTVAFDAAHLTPGSYEMTLVLEHNDPAQNPAIQIPVTLEVVAQAAGVTVVADTVSQTAVPGESVVYAITITNTGNAPDSFTIDAAGIWATSLSATNTGLLGIGESVTIMATVTIPATAEDGHDDVTAVTVTSAFDPAVSQTVSLTTTAAVPIYWLYLPTVIKP